MVLLEEETEKEIENGWYLVKTFPGKEAFAVDFIINNAIEEGCSKDIVDHLVPKFLEEGRKSEYASVMMGYFVMNLRLTPKLLKVLNKVENARVHLGGTKTNKDGKKTHSKSVINHKITFHLKKKMSESDLERMTESSKIYNEIKNVFSKNEQVCIVDGPLKGVNGIIQKIVNKKVHLDVEIFGRRVSIELDMSKIKKED